MVYAEEHSSLLRAIPRERQLKRWTRKKKEELIVGDRAALKSLSRRATLTSPGEPDDPTFVVTP
jgi:predicted GIY-YIG superfamily endonuclease